MKKATFDADGLPTAFYSDEINAVIPPEAIAITDEQWLDFINNPCFRKWENGAVVPYVPPTAAHKNAV
jgi:hypothetical protein